MKRDLHAKGHVATVDEVKLRERKPEDTKRSELRIELTDLAERLDIYAAPQFEFGRTSFIPPHRFRPEQPFKIAAIVSDIDHTIAKAEDVLDGDNLDAIFE